MNEPETPTQDQQIPDETGQSGPESDATGDQVESDLNVLDDEVSKLNEEKAQIHDQLLRTMADFQNFRKRTQQEQGLIRQYATESLIMTLLPVMDNFERTVAAAEKGAPIESYIRRTRHRKAIPLHHRAAGNHENTIRWTAIRLRFARSDRHRQRHRPPQRDRRRGSRTRLQNGR